jgi:amyloid beta precursor protein binding protein 1
MTGYRLRLKKVVVDSHPDSTHTLRIDAPFPALEAYAKDLDLGSMDSMEHSHVPWVVLLVKAASMWKESVGTIVKFPANDQHGGQVPRDLSDDGGPDEQREFKALLNGMKHKADEENFDEAFAQAYQVWGESQVSRRCSQRMLLLMHRLAKSCSFCSMTPVSSTYPKM